MSKVKELREKRAAIAQQMTDLIPKDGSGLTPENRTKFDAMDADQKQIKADIDRYEAADKLEAEVRAQATRPASEGGPTANMTEEQRTAHEKQYRKAFFDA